MSDSNAFSDQADDPLALFEPEAASVPAKPESSPAGTSVKAPALRVATPAPASGPTAQEPGLVSPAANAPSPAPAAADFSDDLAFLRTPLPSERMVAADAATDLEPVRPAPLDVAVEALGPPPPAGSVSFDHVCSVKGLGFVEGVALIQGVSAAVTEAGPEAGVPELHGLFLTSAGEVVLHGPPTGEQPAREMARLLHQLVAPNLMPPAGRLFVGRWINSDIADLNEFSSELAYFARPNGRELLAGLHKRCNGAPPVAEVRRRPERVRQRRAKEEPAKPEPPRSFSGYLLAWMRDHKPEVTAAIAVMSAVVATGLVTWIWQSSTAAASRPPVEARRPIDSTPVDGPPEAGPGTPASGRNNAAKMSNGLKAPARSRASVPVAPSSRSGVPPPGTTPPIQSQNVAEGLPPAAPPPVLPSSAIPDLRIYSANDGGVEPPVLRSAEIPEILITGFQTRENVVELVISEKGEVQQATMVGPPQRMPDVMLLSRAKQLHFDPAVRNGIPVRYRLRLSWKVTP